MKDALRAYLEDVVSLFGPMGDDAGCDQASLDVAEARLGLPLPQRLWEHYRHVGNHSFNRRHHRLLTPEQLYVTEGMLVFFTENQDAIAWGTPLETIEQPDPPVLEALDDSLADWLDDHDDMSGFFRTMALFQRLFSPISDWRTAVPRAVADRVGGQWPEVRIEGSHRPPLERYFRRESEVICVMDLNEPDGVRVGWSAATPERLDEMASLLFG